MKLLIPFMMIITTIAYAEKVKFNANGVYELSIGLIESLEVGVDNSRQIKKEFGHPVHKDFSSEAGFRFIFLVEQEKVALLDFNKQRILKKISLVEREEIKHLKLKMFGHSKTVNQMVKKSPQINLTLMPKSTLICEKLQSELNENIPADLMTAAKDCMVKNEVEKASQYIMLALVYLDYDLKRVKIGRHLEYYLPKQLFAPLDKLSGWQSFLLSQRMDYFRNKNTKLCNDIEKIGKPSYFPDYLLKFNQLDEAADFKLDIKNYEYIWRTAKKNTLNCE